MKILAFDTTTSVVSVCLTENEKLVSEITLNCKQNHSTLLMPIIKQVMESSQTDIKEIDFIACSKGPGSFTGLRVGASTAKALALSLNKKIISVPTLEALAYNIFKTEKTIVPIIDAKAGNVFFALYKWNVYGLDQIFPQSLESFDELLNYIKKNDIDPIFVGEGISIYSQKIKDFDPSFQIAEERFNLQRAYTLASLAFNYAKKGEYLKFDEFQIEYIQKSQAEIQLEERQIKR